MLAGQVLTTELHFLAVSTWFWLASSVQQKAFINLCGIAFIFLYCCEWNVYEGIKTARRYGSENFEVEREILSTPSPTAGMSSTVSLTGGDRCAQSFVEQCALWNRVGSAHLPLSRFPVTLTHDTLLPKQYTRSLHTFCMTARQVFENSNLVPL